MSGFYARPACYLGGYARAGSRCLERLSGMLLIIPTILMSN